jgi:hypothetical protein
VTDLLTLILQIALPLLGSGGIVTYAIHKMQHRIALLQQELDERRLDLNKQQVTQDFGLQSFKEVLAVREAELARVRGELEQCRAAQQDVSDLKRARDLLLFRLQAAADEVKAWKTREVRYRATEQELLRLERQADQHRWKEDLIIQRVERVMHANRQMRLENRRLKQELGIALDDTAELPDLALIGDVRAFLRGNEDNEDAG